MHIYHDHFRMNNLSDIAYTIGVVETSAHIHHTAEMALVLDGQVTVTSQNHSYTVSKGGIFFINALSSHSYKAEGAPAILVFIGFNYPFLLNMFPDLASRNIDFILPDGTCDSPVSATLRTIMLAIYSNRILNTSESLAFNHAAVSVILSILHQNYLCSDASERNTDMSMTNRNEQIESFIFDNFNKKININALAEYLHLSPYYTAHYFKKVFQTTFNYYLTSLRITNAKYMLLAKKSSVTEIAMNCGFESSSSFSRVFKDAEGISPSEFRKQYISTLDFDEWENIGFYRTRSGLYVAFTQKQHTLHLQKALASIPHDSYLFRLFAIDYPRS